MPFYKPGTFFIWLIAIVTLPCLGSLDHKPEGETPTTRRTQNRPGYEEPVEHRLGVGLRFSLQRIAQRWFASAANSQTANLWTSLAIGGQHNAKPCRLATSTTD